MTDELRQEARLLLQNEKAFPTKEQALEEAVKRSKKLNSNLTVCEFEGKYAIVKFENLEAASILECPIVYDTGDIYDKVKEGYDIIDEA